MAKTKFSLKVKSKIDMKSMIDKLKPFKMKYGFLDGKSGRYPDGESVALVAMQNNYGAVVTTENWQAKADLRGKNVKVPPVWNIPSRPFFTNAWAKNNKRYQKYIVNYMNAIVGGKVKVSRETFFKRLGRVATDDVKKSIDVTNTPANHPLTIYIKDSEKPLVDTGHMKESVVWDVEDA